MYVHSATNPYVQKRGRKVSPLERLTRPSPASAGGTSGPRPRFGGEKTKELLNKSSIIDRQKRALPARPQRRRDAPVPRGPTRGVPPPPVPRAVPPCSGLSPGGVTVPGKAASTRYENTGLLMVFPHRHHRTGGYMRMAPSTGGQLAPVGSWDWRWEMRSHPNPQERPWERGFHPQHPPRATAPARTWCCP